MDPSEIAAFSVTRSGFAAALVAALTTLLIFGTRLDPAAYAGICFAVQALFVVAWTLGSKPPGPPVVATVGVTGAVAADLAAVYASEASLAPLGFVTAGAFVLGVVGQLARGKSRARVTESIGSSAVVAVGVVALATPVLLSRLPSGAEALMVCLLAAGVGLAVAHLADMAARRPRISPHVPRGAVGVVLGAMAGTAVAGGAGSLVQGLTPTVTAVAGLVVAVTAVLADLGMAFAETGRLLAGEKAAPWPVRALVGPLVALAVAAPAAYLLSVLMMVKGF